jgi:hypothetical protein
VNNALSRAGNVLNSGAEEDNEKEPSGWLDIDGLAWRVQVAIHRPG